MTEPTSGDRSRSAASASSPQSDRQRPLAKLLARVWRSVIQNRKLVLAVIVTALLQAFFTKAPLFLIKPVGDALGNLLGKDEVPATDPQSVEPRDAAPGVPEDVPADVPRDAGELTFGESLEVALLDWVDDFSVWPAFEHFKIL